MLRASVLLPSIVVLVSAGCTNEPEPLDAGGDSGVASDTSLPDAPPADLAVGNVSLFGFVAVDCGYDDPLDAPASRTEYVDEVSGFTNVAHLCTFGADEDVTARLERLRAAGLRGMLDISNVLFERVPGESLADPAHRMSLRADAEARLTRWMGTNSGVLDATHVAALYVVDEPAWNGLPMDELADALRSLDAATDLPLFFVEAGAALDRLVIPTETDLVGFDRYDTLDPENDATWRRDLSSLLALRSRPEQRVVLVMDTQWRPYYGEAGVSPADMAFVARSTIAVAADTPEVVGIVGYLWPGGLDLPDPLGARRLPACRQRLPRASASSTQPAFASGNASA